MDIIKQHFHQNMTAVRHIIRGDKHMLTKVNDRFVVRCQEDREKLEKIVEEINRQLKEKQVVEPEIVQD